MRWLFKKQFSIFFVLAVLPISLALYEAAKVIDSIGEYALWAVVWILLCTLDSLLTHRFNKENKDVL